MNKLERLGMATIGLLTAANLGLALLNLERTEYAITGLKIIVRAMFGGAV